jgi:hypothetical protein
MFKIKGRLYEVAPPISVDETNIALAQHYEK